jgi:hypothetical protein
MVELAMMMYLPRKIPIILLRALKNNLQPSNISFTYLPFTPEDQTHLRPIGKFMSSQINLSKTAFAYQTAQSVITHMAQVFGTEFTVILRVSSLPYSQIERASVV